MTGKKTKVASTGEEFILSHTEAKRRLKIEGYPSLEQIIRRAKAKTDWPDERWDEIRRIAAAAEKPDALVVNRKTVFADILPPDIAQNNNMQNLQSCISKQPLQYQAMVCSIFVPHSICF